MRCVLDNERQCLEQQRAAQRRWQPAAHAKVDEGDAIRGRTVEHVAHVQVRVKARRDGAAALGSGTAHAIIDHGTVKYRERADAERLRERILPA